MMFLASFAMRTSVNLILDQFLVIFVRESVPVLNCFICCDELQKTQFVVSNFLLEFGGVRIHLLSHFVDSGDIFFVPHLMAVYCRQIQDFRHLRVLHKSLIVIILVQVMLVRLLGCISQFVNCSVRIAVILDLRWVKNWHLTSRYDPMISPPVCWPAAVLITSGRILPPVSVYSCFQQS